MLELGSIISSAVDSISHLGRTGLVEQQISRAVAEGATIITAQTPAEAIPSHHSAGKNIDAARPLTLAEATEEARRRSFRPMYKEIIRRLPREVRTQVLQAESEFVRRKANIPDQPTRYRGMSGGYEKVSAR